MFSNTWTYSIGSQCKPYVWNLGKNLALLASSGFLCRFIKRQLAVLPQHLEVRKQRQKEDTPYLIAYQSRVLYGLSLWEDDDWFVNRPRVVKLSLLDPQTQVTDYMSHVEGIEQPTQYHLAKHWSPAQILPALVLYQGSECSVKWDRFCLNRTTTNTMEPQSWLVPLSQWCPNFSCQPPFPQQLMESVRGPLPLDYYTTKSSSVEEFCLKVELGVELGMGEELGLDAELASEGRGNEGRAGVGTGLGAEWSWVVLSPLIWGLAQGLLCAPQNVLPRSVGGALQSLGTTALSTTTTYTHKWTNAWNE